MSEGAWEGDSGRWEGGREIVNGDAVGGDRSPNLSDQARTGSETRSHKFAGFRRRANLQILMKRAIQPLTAHHGHLE